MNALALTLLTLPLPLPTQEPAAFPATPAAEQGVDPGALELLVAEVERLQAADAFVGAELHVIQNRRTVLHQAFGYADRDEERALEVDSLYCIRSMTKPLVGTAIQMLIDEGRLAPDTRAAEILPSWDTPATRDITIDQLLTHRTGLPFSTITRALHTYADLGEVAAEAATTKLLFEPGTSFQYSDGGSDTLGAIVAAVTGQPVEVFLQERLLDPLGMSDSVTLLDPEGEPLARLPSSYSGGRGNWVRHWHPSDTPIYPFFLTSQSLYSTTSDYASFLTLWMDGGRDLLSPEAVERGLSPRSELMESSGFPGLRMMYGQQWISYAAEAGAGIPVVFGHNGSDGTYAWAWPERDLIVLFFTQTRGTLSGFDVERVVSRVLVEGDVDGYRAELVAKASGAADLHSYEGLYWDEDNWRAYYVVRAGEKQLTIERPGSFTQALEPTGEPGHFELAGPSSRVLEFETPVAGSSPAFHLPFTNRVERQVRHAASAELPELDAILAHLHRGHGLDASESAGIVRMTGKMEIRARGIEGRVETEFDATRLYFRVEIAGHSEAVWVTEDERVFKAAGDEVPDELEDPLRLQALRDHPLRRLGGWSEDYAGLQVLRTHEEQGRRAVLVRAFDESGESTTKIIDLDAGQLLAQDGFETIPGLGRIGVTTAYGEFREYEGLQIPTRIHLEYASPFIGEIDFTYETIEAGSEAAFEVPLPIAD